MKRFLLASLLLLTVSACSCQTDSTPPVIASISASDISYSGVTITWTTNEAATSEVEYGTTDAYGSTTMLSKMRVKSHTVELTGLNPDTTYYYRVRSEDASGNEIISTGKSFHTNAEEIFSITYQWYFMGSSWEYTTEIPESEYDYFSNKPRAGGYDEYVLNPEDDLWMKNLADLFTEEAEAKGWYEPYYIISFVLSFVQSMPYTSDDVTTGYDEYPRYPVETIVKGGDCEDTSILFASIVREMGYGAALLLLDEDGHMAAGVLISQYLIDNWDANYPYELTYYTDTASGKKYAYCETTERGWELGEMPGELVGKAVILDVFLAL